VHYIIHELLKLCTPKNSLKKNELNSAVRRSQFTMCKSHVEYAQISSTATWQCQFVGLTFIGQPQYLRQYFTTLKRGIETQLGVVVRKIISTAREVDECLRRFGVV